MSTLTQRKLKELVSYDRETGVFTSLRNNLPIGHNHKGYLAINIEGKPQLAHRLAFLWEYGEFPPEMVDHIDGNRTNNKLVNLRACTNQQNQRNRGLSKSNRSGFKGVSWDKQLGKWRVKLTINRRTIHFGSFSCLELASLVASEAQDKYFKEFNYKGK